MAIGGMEVFGSDYHFGKKPTKEGVSSSKGTPSYPTKGKKKGYGGPKTLKPHSKSHEGGRTGKSIKETGNEYLSPKDNKDIPSKVMVSVGKTSSTANTLRKGKDPIWSGYSKKGK